ncbi:MAG: hypothetical protein HFH68_12380 [Lachnospiraceae bacterium]|nr:hypothetical protein [Lachnospiraceae bacterium]
MDYNPEKLKDYYEEFPHGKPRMDGIKAAIEAADQNNDVPFMIYFREQICHEACFYGDSMYLMVVFPEMLSIIDRYPDTPSTQFDSGYVNALDHILWVYKWLIDECSSFYQIPMDDCLKFFEDYKKRSVSFGYNLKPYYRALYNFYVFDEEKRADAFYNFEKIPRDSNSDCKACERNTEIGFYLDKGDFGRAVELSKDIENFKLKCGNYWDAWLRMKISFLDYYLNSCMFEEASEIAGLLEHRINEYEKIEYQAWDLIINCYAHTKPGRALRLYKKHWKQLEDGTPHDLFDSASNICCFWDRIRRDGRETVRLHLDRTFSLYNEENIYKTEDLFNYYYSLAKDIAGKFDKRNNASSYMETLAKSLDIARK